MKTIKLFALIVALAFLWACGGGGNSSSSAPGPTPGPAGTATFISNGGAGGTGTGGYGGGIAFGWYDDILGDVWVTRSGSVDTSFTVPTYAASYGANKLTISANTVAKLDLAGVCVAGDVYLTTGNTDLSYCAVTNTPLVATGLEVRHGVTLTLPDNYPSDSQGNYTGATGLAEIFLDKAVIINGTVKPADDGVGLSIISSSLLQIGATGTVTTKPATAGTDGGYIYLLGMSGVVINRGTIDASGSDATAASAPGGAAGEVNFDVDSSFYNTGNILAKGGASTSGDGGKGRAIHIYTYTGGLFNSGTIDNSGGNGATGGRGGWNIKLYGGWGSGPGPGPESIGSVIVSGSLKTNGGNGITGDGGYGGYINFESQGGKIWSNATISTKGGSSTAAAGDYGGDFYLYSGYSYVSGPDTVAETQGIKLSGDIDLSGGNGATGGGYGGVLAFENNYSEFINGGPLPSPAVAMVGFAHITMDGGAGASGGNGGGYEIATTDYWIGTYDGNNPPYWIPVPTGSIVNQVPVSAKGGAGSTGNGGYGGRVEFYQDDDSYDYTIAVNTSIVTINNGAINLSGGDGYINGGYGGDVEMYGYGKLTNSGAINLKGGAGTTGNGGDSDLPMAGIEFLSVYDIENTGAIDAAGGAGAINGGSGAYVAMYADGKLTNHGAINAAGGTGTSNTGGYGGYIDLYSVMTTSNSGSLTATGGTGGITDGSYGLIFIDGVDVTPAH
jgi:hypothetical protein